MYTNPKAISFVVIAVLLNVLAQYLLKFSASIREPIEGSTANVASGLLQILLTPACIFGLLSGFLASMFWILALNCNPPKN